MAHTVYTIGYSGFSRPDLLALLKQKGISLLVGEIFQVRGKNILPERWKCPRRTGVPFLERKGTEKNFKNLSVKALPKPVLRRTYGAIINRDKVSIPFLFASFSSF